MKLLAFPLALLALAVGLLYALLCYVAGLMGGWDE